MLRHPRGSLRHHVFRHHYDPVRVPRGGRDNVCVACGAERSGVLYMVWQWQWQWQSVAVEVAVAVAVAVEVTPVAVALWQ